MKEEQIEKVSYWNIVWEQFSKGVLPMFGLIAVATLVLLAIYAPIISLDKPFFYSTSEGFNFPGLQLFLTVIFLKMVLIFFSTFKCF